MVPLGLNSMYRTDDEFASKGIRACQSNQAAVFVAERVELTRWGQLLCTLGLTEREALEAIRRDGDIGRSIRRFVQNSRRQYFVPEDVLLAIAKAERK